MERSGLSRRGPQRLVSGRHFRQSDTADFRADFELLCVDGAAGGFQVAVEESLVDSADKRKPVRGDSAAEGAATQQQGVFVGFDAEAALSEVLCELCGDVVGRRFGCGDAAAPQVACLDGCCTGVRRCAAQVGQ